MSAGNFQAVGPCGNGSRTGYWRVGDRSGGSWSSGVSPGELPFEVSVGSGELPFGGTTLAPIAATAGRTT